MIVPDAVATAAAVQACYPFGPVIQNRLIGYWRKDPEQFWSEKLTAKNEVNGAAKFFDSRSHWLELGRNNLRNAARTGCRVVISEQHGYPDQLKQIYAPPVLLYWKGSLDLFSCRPVTAVVGTRKPTPGGRVIARRIGRALAAGGYTVVSGGAYGIDAAVLQGAIQTGYPAAVMPCGFGRFYPQKMRSLIEQISEQGVVATELPPFLPVRRYVFPLRNRLLAGLAVRVIIVQAPLRSGALLTAQSALDEGREVRVVPWPEENSSGAGCRRLLEEGAAAVPEHPYWSAEPVLRFYFKRPAGYISRNAAKLLPLLGIDCCFIEQLIERTGMQAPQVEAAVSELELAGVVDYWPGGGYTRKLLKSA